MHKLLGADMRKCTTVLQKARRQLTELQESKKSHQLAWIAHVKETTKVWQEQSKAYASQQEDFMQKITAVQEELRTAQQSIQELGSQALEQNVKEEDLDGGAQLDLEQAKQAQRLAEALTKAAALAEHPVAAAPAPMLEVRDSDEDKEDEQPNKSRRMEERKRSLERPEKDSANASS